MMDRPRYQRDLFEAPAAPKNLPIGVKAPLRELLEALLTEALAVDSVEAHDANKEAGDDQDHA